MRTTTWILSTLVLVYACDYSKKSIQNYVESQEGISAYLSKSANTHTITAITYPLATMEDEALDAYIDGMANDGTELQFIKIYREAADETWQATDAKIK